MLTGILNEIPNIRSILIIDLAIFALSSISVHCCPHSLFILFMFLILCQNYVDNELINDDDNDDDS